MRSLVEQIKLGYEDALRAEGLTTLPAAFPDIEKLYVDVVRNGVPWGSASDRQKWEELFVPFSVATDLGTDLYEGWDVRNFASLTIVDTDRVSAIAGIKGLTTLIQTTANRRPVYSATSFGGEPGLFFDNVTGEENRMSVNLTAATYLPFTGVGVELWARVDQQTATGTTGTKVALSYGATSGNGTRRVIERRGEVGGASNPAAYGGDGAANISASGAAKEPFFGIHTLRGRITTTGVSVYLDNQLVSHTASTTVDDGVSSTGAIQWGGNPSGGSPWFGYQQQIYFTKPLTYTQAVKFHRFINA